MCEVAFGITAMVRFLRLPHAASASPAKADKQTRLLSTPATVDEDICSGDESRIVGAEIGRKLPDILHIPPSSNGDLLEELLVYLGILHQHRIHLGTERSRT